MSQASPNSLVFYDYGEKIKQAEIWPEIIDEVNLRVIVALSDGVSRREPDRKSLRRLTPLVLIRMSRLECLEEVCTFVVKRRTSMPPSESTR